jgi:hypothetical protein
MIAADASVPKRAPATVNGNWIDFEPNRSGGFW